MWASRIQSGLTKSNLSAFLYWLGYTDVEDNSMLIRVNHDEDSYEVSKRLWAFAHFGRFVRPGAVRISALSDSESLTASAFINTDGSISLQVINLATNDQSLAVSGFSGFNRVTPVLTNEQNNLTFQSDAEVTNGSFDYSIPARSIVTFWST